MKQRLAILASGNGTNAEAIIKYFEQSSKGDVVLVASNKADAFVLQRAEKLDIPTVKFTKTELISGAFTEILKSQNIDWVVLAGFLLHIPGNLTQAFPNQIVNIHPALLPNYGGKGMYGMHVHQAVKDAGEPFTGITIHLVNENYDEGKIIFQSAVPIDASDSPEKIAQKVHELEHKYFPNVIESLL